MKSLGRRLKHARSAKGLTQGELSEESGVPQGTISKIERGDQQSTAYVVELAEALGCSATWLSSGKGPIEVEAHSKDRSLEQLVECNRLLLGRINAMQAVQHLLFSVLISQDAALESKIRHVLSSLHALPPAEDNKLLTEALEDLVHSASKQEPDALFSRKS